MYGPAYREQLKRYREAAVDVLCELDETAVAVRMGDLRLALRHSARCVDAGGRARDALMAALVLVEDATAK